MNNQVATTIKSQISAGTKMNTGARDYTFDSTSLTFKVGNGRKLRAITVTLADDDTYTTRYVEVNRRTYNIDTDKSIEGVYCTELNETILGLVNS